jgi:hypothetical protein
MAGTGRAALAAARPFTNLEELSVLARSCMTQMAYDYYASGAETETSVADNRQVRLGAWRRLAASTGPTSKACCVCACVCVCVCVLWCICCTQAFADYRILPRILVDVSKVDTSCHAFGELWGQRCCDSGFTI